MKARWVAQAMSVAMVLAFNAGAFEGILVNTMWRERGTSTPPERNLYRAGSGFGGKLIKYTIVDDGPKKIKIAQVDTLTDLVSSYGRINLEGTKVAFIHWNATLKNNQLSGAGDQCYLSVMDIDGSNLQDLIEVACPFGRPNYDWPEGDWIYYEKYGKRPSDGKMRGSNQIWRVNVNTKQNEMFTCQTNGIGQLWNLDASGNFQAGAFDGGYYNGSNIPLASCFPAPGGKLMDCAFFWHDLNTQERIPWDGGCNMAISATGRYLISHEDGGHKTLNPKRWYHGENNGLYFIDVSGRSGLELGIKVDEELLAWSGETDITFQNSERPMWSNNSDQWMMQEFGDSKGTHKGGADCWLINWCDSIALKVTDNEGLFNGYHHQSTAGDFWVKPPAGEEGKIQTANGSWVDIEGSHLLPMDDPYDEPSKPLSPAPSMTPGEYAASQDPSKINSTWDAWEWGESCQPLPVLFDPLEGTSTHSNTRGTRNLQGSVSPRKVFRPRAGNLTGGRLLVTDKSNALYNLRGRLIESPAKK